MAENLQSVPSPLNILTVYIFTQFLLKSPFSSVLISHHRTANNCLTTYSKPAITITRNLNHSTTTSFCQPYVFPKFLVNGICKQCRPRSDCSFGSSMIRVYTVAILLSTLRNNTIKTNNWPKKCEIKYPKFQDIYCILYSILGPTTYTTTFREFQKWS